MADPEIQKLEKQKRYLLAKLSKLRDELDKQEKRPRRGREVALNQFSHVQSKEKFCRKRVSCLSDPQVSPFDRTCENLVFQQSLNDLYDQKDDTKSSKKSIARSVEVSQSVLGVQFKNVERNWIHDDIYRYDAHVVTRAIQFCLELTVDVKGDDKHRIEDINCHFINLDKCYLGEITPWTLRFTREKDFAHLMLAVSEYSEISVTRAKILSTLESNRYVSIEKCNEEGGGILAYVHPTSDDEKILFKFKWNTEFVDRTWHVENIFAIESIQAEEDFIEANKDLLEGFCKTGLGKTDLEKLWKDLCTAIDTLK